MSDAERFAESLREGAERLAMLQSERPHAGLDQRRRRTRWTGLRG